jgi:hypothetical protein
MNIGRFCVCVCVCARACMLACTCRSVCMCLLYLEAWNIMDHTTISLNQHYFFLATVNLGGVCSWHYVFGHSIYQQWSTLNHKLENAKELLQTIISCLPIMASFIQLRVTLIQFSSYHSCECARDSGWNQEKLCYEDTDILLRWVLPRSDCLQELRFIVICIVF